MTIPKRLRGEVLRRAGDRCEYCGLSQAGQEARFHIDHIVPVAKGGATESENLALARVSCSLRRGARDSARDPRSGRVVSLFHPRRNQWADHFSTKGCRIEGITATGRATVAALQFNRAIALAIRAEEKFRDRFPPPW
jgi:hypothetical protein